MDLHDDKILILDFGAQYTQLIARRIREFGVYCEVWAWDHDPAEIAAWGARGIILSGGPESTTEADSPRIAPEVFAAGVLATYGGELLFTYDTAIDGFAAVLPDAAVTTLQNDPAVAFVPVSQFHFADDWYTFSAYFLHDG